MSKQLKESIWNNQTEWLLEDAQGQSGGIITIWDNRNLKIIRSETNRNWVWTRWQVTEASKDDTKVINGINVYGPQNSAGKKALWEELNHILQ